MNGHRQHIGNSLIGAMQPGLFLFLAVLMILSSCYFDEGPVSLRTRKNRLDNTWAFNRVYENGVVVTPEFLGRTIRLTNDHDVITRVNTVPVLWGKWEWHDAYDRIVFLLRDSEGRVNYFEWSIKELRKTKMVAEEYTMGNLMRYELVPAYK